MPRAFLITHRRYNNNAVPDAERREVSPERRVSIPESTDDGAAPWFSGDSAGPAAVQTSSECPDELYNLTQLAEVSLAAAAGQISWNHFASEAAVAAAVAAVTAVSSKNNEKLQDNQCNLSIIGPNSEGAAIGHGTGNEMHTCSDCGKRYSTSSNLARHRQTHRSLGDKKARRCPHCDKVYVSMPAFSMHVRTHNQGCKCPYCGKCFSRPWLLQGHIRTHTGEKPFKCSICTKAFADKSNLRAHVQTHSNTKPHVCNRCGKAFALKSYLYKHEESSCMRLYQHQHHNHQQHHLHPPSPSLSSLPAPTQMPTQTHLESQPPPSSPPHKATEIGTILPSSPTSAIHHFLHPANISPPPPQPHPQQPPPTHLLGLPIAV